jgi:hypothetical protein
VPVLIDGELKRGKLSQIVGKAVSDSEKRIVSYLSKIVHVKRSSSILVDKIMKIAL